ncbi:MAG: DUF1684 domain-containing protein [Desulfurivibrionaceae bacterium]
MKKEVFLSLIVIFMALSGCQSDSQEKAGVSDDYLQKVEKFRENKDAFFKNNQQSPIPAGERNSFEGLAYYSPDPDYRIKGTYEPYSEPEKRGGRMLAVGRLSFSLKGKELDLEVWSSRDSEQLSVMFTDPTNKDETYKAGRYLELQRDLDGSFIIDFNRAYNPYCHYNPIYDCPLPPRENHIPIPVKAGEKRLD